MQIFLFIALLIAGLAAVFALQNSTPVQVTFLTWKFDSTLAMVLLVALAAGALISFLISLPGSLRARWVVRQQRKKMTEMETGLTETKENLAAANARLDDAKARADLLESKLTMLDVVENPAADKPAVEAPKETPASSGRTLYTK